MKIKTVYFNKEGAPMVLPRPWPEVPPVMASINADMFAVKAYEKDMDQAKRESVPLEGFEAFSHAPGIILAADTFIDVDNEVEFFKQYRNISGIWVDVDFIDPYVQAQYQTRTIARVVPEKAEDGAHSYTEGADVTHDALPQVTNVLVELEETKQQLAAAQARVKELDTLIKSDVVYALLRFGYKNPCSSGCDNFEGSENIDLYNISSELRTKTEG